ncbi:hypothetical protein CL614_03330 [archaeon]|nr:hypothetical protein [archaeon]
MRNTFLIIIILLLILNINLGYASLIIDINIEEKFYEETPLSFSYNITSDQDYNLSFKAWAECSTHNIPFENYNEEIISEETINKVYDPGFIIFGMDSQTCTSYVEVTSPIQQREEKTFEISALPSFSFSIDLEKIVFLKNEQINLDYTSKVSNPSIIASLTSPSGNMEDVQIPSTLQLDEIGTYIINVQVSKQGYKTMQISRQIGVIEGEVDIPFTNPDVNVLDNDIPTDSADSDISGTTPEEGSDILVGTEESAMPDYLLYIIVIIILVILIVIYLKMRNNTNEEIGYQH